MPGALNAQTPTPFHTANEARIPVIGPADLADLDEVDEDEQPMEALRLFQGFDGGAFQECVAKVRTMATQHGCKLQDAPSLQLRSRIALRLETCLYSSMVSRVFQPVMRSLKLLVNSGCRSSTESEAESSSSPEAKGWRLINPFA